MFFFFFFVFVAVDFQGSLGKVSSASVQHPRQMVDLTIMRNTKGQEQVCVIANYASLSSALFSSGGSVSLGTKGFLLCLVNNAQDTSKIFTPFTVVAKFVISTTFSDPLSDEEVFLFKWNMLTIEKSGVKGIVFEPKCVKCSVWPSRCR